VRAAVHDSLPAGASQLNPSPLASAHLSLAKTPYVLLLTGTAGSGKSTVAQALAGRHGWLRVCEDDIWRAQYGKDRGAFGSNEHRAKRAAVHNIALSRVGQGLAEGNNVVLEATLHQAPPEAFDEYRAALEARGASWRLCVLHPRLEVAVARDAARTDGPLGAERVAQLRTKFAGAAYPPECFLDTSDESVEESVNRVLALGAR